MRRTEWLVTALLVAGLAGCGGMADGDGMAKPPAPMAQRTSLYDRLGGMPAIEAVTDTFLQNVAADPAINRRFARTDIPRLRGLLVEQLCAATGGPCIYGGKPMPEAHKGMQITGAEFDAMGGDLAKALDAHAVPAAERDELLKALGGMRPQIVGL
ncbi:MAG: group 1 truncated hemoglobin [Geminicoccaceae bacterium]